MQLGQILPYWDCERQTCLSAAISVAAALGAALGGVVSWRSARSEGHGFGAPGTVHFAAQLSALSSLVFAFALAMQAIASVVLTGCER
ncbi:MAG: hypothetical protein JOY90_13490 [Bradyrhizobium sp.]|uniref:hypothetical protein n=1 Tax=Bradyrhizobium sp. TaxID=376 RepID=UPI001D577740|nr:hypothetical protein [Bradyrhizobium sp.]MBV9561443.1 hypothetical protein [Bradyrhizobium sp.]